MVLDCDVYVNVNSNFGYLFFHKHVPSIFFSLFVKGEWCIVM